jgi:signal transduction histidine kinase
MKLLFFFFLLLFTNLEVKATNLLPEKTQTVPEHSNSYFLRKINETLRFQNLDSLDVVFSDFVKDKIKNNQLAQGHAALNQIIADSKLSDTLKILAYKNKAILFGQIDYTKKRKAFESAIKIIRQKGILHDLQPVYEVEIAKTYLSQSNFLGATKALNKVNIASIQNPEKKVEILGVCGLIYARMDDSIQALKKLDEAVSIATKNNDYFGLGTIHSSLGNIYSTNFHHPQKAIVHFRISMNAFEKAGYDHYALGSQADIGVTYSRMKILDSALYYLQKSYDESIKMGSIFDQSICAKELGMLYNQLKKPQKALNMCKEAKDLIWDYASDNFRYSCASCLSKAYETLHQYDSSLVYYKLYHLYRDSTFNKDETKALAKFNAELEKQVFVAEQEKINLKKDQLLKTRKLYITFLSILALLISGIFLLILRGNINRKKRELIEQEEKSQRAFSQQLLQSQEDEKIRISRELHDSVGQDLILLKNKAQSLKDQGLESCISETLNNVRRITQGLHPFVLERFGLTSALKKLIETVDANSSIFISEEVDEIDNLLTKQQELGVYRIVQESINNILKHSESPSALIVVAKEMNTIVLKIKDYGKGFDWSEKSKIKNSLGMKTLQERAKILNAELSITSIVAKGTTIHLKIPIKDA